MAFTTLANPIQLANPTKFMAFSGRLLPFLWAITVALVAAALYMAFVASPPDEEMGALVLIMYLHVPAVWFAMLCYVAMAIAALGSLVWRHPLADVMQKAAAPIGAVFTLLGLITGSLWGRPAWNTYWVWDARLTSFLVLFIIYLGLITVWRTIEDPGRAGRVASILTLVGAINIPIIHFAVSMNTLHQQASVFTATGSKVNASMMWPLMLMTVGFTFLFACLLFTRMRTEILRRRLRSLQMRAADAAA